MNANEDSFEAAYPFYRLQYTLEGYQSPIPINLDYEQGPSIWCVNFSPSGQSIASSGEGIIDVWDAAGKLERQLGSYDINYGYIGEVDWSKDGSLLLSTGYRLKIWNVNTGKRVKTVGDRELIMLSAKFSPDDSLILSGSDDHTARIWDAKSGKCLNTLTNYNGYVAAVDFHPDGTRFMTTSRNGCCYVHDLRSMAIVEDFSSEDLLAEDRLPEAAKFCPGSSYILFSMRDYSLRLYDMRKQKFLGIYKGYINDRSLCRNFLLTTSGKYIVSGSFDNLVYIWDVNTQEIVQVLEGHSGKVEGVACHPENDTIASCSRDNSMKIWKCS